MTSKFGDDISKEKCLHIHFWHHSERNSRSKLNIVLYIMSIAIVRKLVHIAEQYAKLQCIVLHLH